MDRNNLLQILKTLTEMMHCPHCGEVYSLDEVQYISQVEGYCLLQVSCKRCRIPVWVNFFVEKENQRPKQTGINDFKINDLKPITVDEVIDFHETISNFSGDFKTVFKTK